VAKHGPEKASWYVGWFEPSGRRKGKSCGPGYHGKQKADKLRRRIEAQLMTGTYQSQVNTTWGAFRQRYEEKVVAGLSANTRKSAKASLDAFQRHVKPRRVYRIATATVDDFIAKRRADPGGKKGSTVSAHTINHDLRHIKAALRVAKEWGLLPTLPKFRMERAPKGLPTYVTGDHFAAIYAACDKARFPRGQPYPAGDRWRALVVMGYMTGWRISDMLGLRRADLDLAAGTAITRAADNKGKRDELVKLHTVVVEHLKKLAGFDSHVFPWDHDRRTLHPHLRRGAGGGRGRAAVRRGARAHPLLPRLRLPRPAAGLRHHERRQADAGRASGPYAAQELPDHAGLHQHGAADGRGRRQPARPGGAEGRRGGAGGRLTHSGSLMETLWKPGRPEST
jgi:integrase